MFMPNISQQHTGGRKGEIVQEIIDYVNNHLQILCFLPILLLTISDFPPVICAGIFKETTQIPLAEYVLFQRIEQVKYLLTETNDTIAVIAEKTGFQTKSHFFSVFKKATGLTPSQFRDAKTSS